MLGTRHGEKIYESLLSREEMSKAEDAVTTTACRWTRGPWSTSSTSTRASPRSHDDYTSHNTERMGVDDVKRLLLALPDVQRELSSPASGAGRGVKVVITGGRASSAGTWRAACVRAWSRAGAPRSRRSRRPGPARTLVADADVVFHLAGVNRAESDDLVEAGNVRAAQELLDVLPRGVHLVFGNTTQSLLDNAYGRGKAAAADLLRLSVEGPAAPSSTCCCPTCTASTVTPTTTPSSRPSATCSPPVANLR